ncbi:MAG: tetratricopeptide repeat protein [Desulfobacteraceae bacterium]|nr:tetratricopeptide repeat protein [Desulfobacteraceae bacterium]MBU4001606.1 tetratricopeptide repeat protein [Pseudomonadota bacterium]MBU4056042.1 tetratricopeptide repeat protein [Pseudomonadota bacterium]
MILKTCSNDKTYGRIFFVCVLLVSLLSCTPKIIRPSKEPQRSPVPIQETSKPAAKDAPVYKPMDKKPMVTKPVEKDVPSVENPQSPRLLASLQLTGQARQHLEEGDADNAIRSLERAVVLDPSNGQNYYYLSEAWLQKGNIDQALKFNELAEIHLANQSRWDAMVIEQKQRILDQSE